MSEIFSRTKLPAAGPERLNLSHVTNLDQLITFISEQAWPDNVKNLTLRIIRTGDSKKIEPILTRLGARTSDINRIFHYRSGRLKSSNLLRNSASKLYNYTKNYILLDLKSAPGYYHSEVGVLIPAFGTSLGNLYEPDSEYYLGASDILVIQSVYEGIQTLTQNRVDSDSLDVLFKYTSQVGYIFDKSTELIYTRGPVRVIKSNDPVALAMNKLDNLIQPYPKGWLLDNRNLLDRLVADPGLVSAANQLLFTQWNESSYTRFGINNVCFYSRIALGDSLIPTLTCQKKYLILPIGIKLGESGHQIILLLNNQTNEGILFDPMGNSHPEVVQYLEKELNSLRRLQEAQHYQLIKDRIGNQVYKLSDLMKLSLEQMALWGPYFGLQLENPRYRELILRMLDLGGLLVKDVQLELDVKIKENISCPLQTGDDLYCMGWSYYVTLLYLLNDLPFEELIDRLYSLGSEGIPVIIPRFLIFLDSEMIEGLLMVK